MYHVAREGIMGRTKIFIPIILVFSLVLVLLCSGCYTTTSSDTTATVVKPVPKIVSVTATTSGTQSAYYATLDIVVKNTGAEGTILVQATVTQDGKTSSNEMAVYLMQNKSNELKLTFPLVWEGGEFTSDVKAVVP
jgi:hypothetical protein